MAFQPVVGQTLRIDEVTHEFGEHPAAPGMPYGQQGRKGTVYRLETTAGARALKVFAPRFREPLLVGQADRMAKYAALTGLTVCRRTVLTARRHPALLREHPDLTYAVLMEWIDGPTWMEVVLDRRAFTPEESLRLARALAEVLVGMEEQGLAHGDLSGGNVMLPGLSTGSPKALSAVELVDVEELYGSELERPTVLPGGSPGYAHRTAPAGLWGPDADRFSGAVLLGEMLSWCDPLVRAAAWGEQYFDPGRIQSDDEHADMLLGALQHHWGATVAKLMERAWQSEVLRDCPTFSEWLLALPDTVPASIPASPQVLGSMSQTTAVSDPAPAPGLPATSVAVDFREYESEEALLARMTSVDSDVVSVGMPDAVGPPNPPGPVRRLPAWTMAGVVALILGGAFWAWQARTPVEERAAPAPPETAVAEPASTQPVAAQPTPAPRSNTTPAVTPATTTAPPTQPRPTPTPTPSSTPTSATVTPPVPMPSTTATASPQAASSQPPPVLPVEAPSFDTPTPADVKLAAERMIELGVLPPALELNSEMTRAELAVILVRAFGRAEDAALLKGAPTFPDTASHWASGSIALLKAMCDRNGESLGFPDGTFQPDSMVTPMQPLTTVMKILGVRPDANKPWPENYIGPAVSAGLIPDSARAALSITNNSTRGMIFYVLDFAFYNFNLGNGQSIYTRYCDTQPPTITVNAAPATVTTDRVTLTGTVSGAASVQTISGAATIAGGSWSGSVPLTVGDNSIQVTARDVAGNATSVTVKIRRTR